MRVPVTDRQRQMMDMPTIASQMPVVFGGNSRWDEFEGYCAECGQSIRMGWLRGRVSRPVPQVAVIEAIGVCEQCLLATEFHYRLHDDMRITGVRNGKWVTWKHEPSWVERLVNLITGRKVA